ncbi:MAG: AraC-like DNA-binding protein, partial [Oceanospirillaceae bacterium]
TSQKVVRVLSKTMASGCISEESVAFELLMSKRTLQRKLQSEGNTFSELLNSLRISLAKQYLTSSLNSVTEITYQLGYSSPSIFSRAFKQNTRYTPMSFREKFKLAS